ncbi:MAG: hypothetical protein EXS55_01080 [Candidatus Magasanikbacteria bacterium]|nr:hypothetical protein [Candidatus Magasanikbacteria bacterium]
MKNAILLYGRFSETIDGVPVVDIPECNPNNENNWMGWTKKQLEKKGYLVTCPIVPKVWEAPYSEWKKVIDEAGVDEETVLVGLSAGAASCVRYIIEKQKIIKKLILIAPARHAAADHPPATKDVYDFVITPDIQKNIKDSTTIFVSNDDWAGILDAVKVYEKELGAKVIRFEDRGHFSFLIKRFPELLEEILK